MVQMFLYEGTAYALIAAAVGVVIGLGVSALILTIAKRILSGLEVVDFEMFIHFEPRSAIVAYCLGMAITFGTVIFSAYRVSRLNIVMAIRDLPQALMPTETPSFRERLKGLLRALARPLIFLVRAFKDLLKRKFTGFIRNVALAMLIPLWIGVVVAAILRFIWPYLLRGWLTVLIGFLFLWWGIAIERDSPFAAGISLVILGLGLMGRKLLQRTSMGPGRVDRIAFTSVALVMLLWWSLWRFIIDKFEAITGELKGDFDMMFVSGIFMVGSAVMAIMWNADLLVKAVNVVAGRAGKLRPVLVTAVAYPMSSKFRTGLTLAMFALVIFTLVVMSVLANSFAATISDPESMAGGWAIRGDVNRNTPIEDIRQAIVDAPRLRMEDFQAIGGYTRVSVGAREIDAKNQRWENHSLSAADDAFLDAAEFKLKLIAVGYGTTPEEVWEALKTQPNLAVVDGEVLGTRARPNSEWPPFAIEAPPYYDDESMSPVDIEVREPRSGTIIPLKVIAVLDQIHENFNWGTIVSKSTLDQAIPIPVPITNYAFRLAEGVDAGKTAKDIEASFLEHGMETEATIEAVEEQLGAFRAFFSIFLGFMGLGVVVGIAGLGVVSTRAVVERRQQIGVLRAIGYRRNMIQLSFLLEFSFVALLGTAIGVILGLILGANAISDIRAEEADQNIRLVIPWVQIVVIIALTYVFSLLATYLPARQASRVYPAEALRYE
jgi:putative ABC transport system permease protein